MTILDQPCPVCGKDWVQLSPNTTEREIGDEILSYMDDRVWQCSDECQLTVFDSPRRDCLVRKRLNAPDETTIYWFVEDQRTEIRRANQNSQILNFTLPYNITYERFIRLMSFL